MPLGSIAVAVFKYSSEYVAAHRSDRVLTNRFLNSACLSRLGMCILSFLILLVCIFTIPAFEHHKLFTILFFGQVLGNCLNPVWFFQGMEKMRIRRLLSGTRMNFQRKR